jgi:polyphosphate kinase
VRGACALRPGVRGQSDNIRVRSILGRFLEHHRIWFFANAGTPDVWLSSADWMGRNMFRRIEVAFPVRDVVLRKRVVEEGLSACLADTRDAWELLPNGAWRKLAPRGRARTRSAQQTLLAAMRDPEESD